MRCSARSSAADIVKQTKLGRLDMSNEPGGAMGMLKKLKGKRQGNAKISAGESQMRMLRNLPKILRFIPGTAQDLRIYFLGMQYWLAGSAGNFESLVRLMVHKYAAGDRASLRTGKAPPPPIEYPDMGGLPSARGGPHRHRRRGHPALPLRPRHDRDSAPALLHPGRGHRAL